MKEKQLDDFKELAESLNQNTQQAYDIYKLAVSRICEDNIQDKNQIEHFLDYILDYCYDEKMLLLFKKLCRHYYKLDPVTTARYVNYYREMWDDENQEQNSKLL